MRSKEDAPTVRQILGLSDLGLLDRRTETCVTGKASDFIQTIWDT